MSMTGGSGIAVWCRVVQRARSVCGPPTQKWGVLHFQPQLAAHLSTPSPAPITTNFASEAANWEPPSFQALQPHPRPLHRPWPTSWRMCWTQMMPGSWTSCDPKPRRRPTSTTTCSSEKHPHHPKERNGGPTTPISLEQNARDSSTATSATFIEPRTKSRLQDASGNGPQQVLTRAQDAIGA
jgi:hypothetical protein